MADIYKYIRKAAASKQADFALPVIDSPEEAIRVAREAAASLAKLPEHQRLSLLSDLDQLSQALAGRVERLRREMDSERMKIRDARFGRQVCNSYARSVSAVINLGARRRPPCP
jgi:hypothetical protein